MSTRSTTRSRTRREAADLPVLLVTFGPQGAESRESRPPRFTYPENAARALARLVRHVEWRSEPRGQLPALSDVRRGEAAEVLAAAVADGGRWLREDEVRRLLDCWGVPMVEQRTARGPAAAGRAAAELGGPVVLKASGEGILHKTELGAVELGLVGEQEVARAARRMSRRLRAAGLRAESFVVQRQLSGGVEMLAGISADPLLGPLVACGAGGTAVEVLGDVAVRLAPITDREAARMVRSLSTFPLLDGYRGAPKADVSALEDVLLRLAALADAHPEVAELDCNPVVVAERGATAVDARVRVEPARPGPAWPALGAEPPSVVSTDGGNGRARMPAHAAHAHSARHMRTENGIALIGYDGSEDAAAAIRHAGSLLGATPSGCHPRVGLARRAVAPHRRERTHGQHARGGRRARRGGSPRRRARCGGGR